VRESPPAGFRGEGLKWTTAAADGESAAIRATRRIGRTGARGHRKMRAAAERKAAATVAARCRDEHLGDRDAT
jgi:hypothetical protein